MSLKPLLRLVSLMMGLLMLAPSFAQPEGKEETGEEHEKFQPGELIIEHISDSHSWHIVGEVHVPLPVILKVPSGLEIFSSGHFTNAEHQPATFIGKYGTYAMHENKIVAVDASGNVDEASTKALWDLSITKNVASLLMSVVFLLLIFISIAKSYKRRAGQAPKGLQSFLEPVILFVRDDIAKNSIGEKHYRKYVPYLLTLFFFIWINNLMGLIPIFPFGANVTGNIATPLVLATITFLTVTFMANWHYWRHMLAMPGIPVPVLVILTPIEIMGHFIRPAVLMVRLFANIMSGHIVLLVFFCLIFIFGQSSVAAGYGTSVPALAFTVFINCLELLVGLLQAYVFTLLTSMYIGTAVAGGHDHHH